MKCRLLTINYERGTPNRFHTSLQTVLAVFYLMTIYIHSRLLQQKLCSAHNVTRHCTTVLFKPRQTNSQTCKTYF